MQNLMYNLDMDYTETNKLIAEFMGMMPEGWEIPNPCMIADVTRQNTMFYFEDIVKEWKEDNLSIWDVYRFHCSWDWLMPVIYKIKDLDGLFPEDDEDSPELEEAMDKFEELFLDNNPVMESIEAANEAVVEFITWYNENNK